MGAIHEGSVTFDTPFIDSNYKVFIENTLSLSSGVSHCVKTKTANGFSISVISTTSGINSIYFDWIAIKL